ncbi:MAG: hypothetical protein K1W24_14535 [Lachnospiraceae bacterium]
MCSIINLGNKNCQVKGILSCIWRIKELDIMCFNKKISEYTKSMLNYMTKIVIKNITEKYEKVKKGLGGIMGGKILEYEAKTILREGIEQGVK